MIPPPSVHVRIGISELENTAERDEEGKEVREEEAEGKREEGRGCYFYQ